MSIVHLSDITYKLLQRRAKESARTPDQVADELLRQELAPQHAYIEIVTRTGGRRAMLRGTRIPVSTIIGYLRIGETPESVTETIMPHLTLAQVYDALSYYHDHAEEIERELEQNSEASGQAYLRERLGAEGYLRVTGQKK
jgi:uncharacterized protein (DUF433 family)